MTSIERTTEIDRKKEKIGSNLKNSSENKTLNETLDPPDSNLSPSYPGRSLENADRSLKKGLVIPVVEVPNPKNMPKIGDGFSNVKCEIKKRRKVKIRERKFSNNQLTPITNFFQKKIDQATIIDSPGKRKCVENLEVESKKFRLGSDYKEGSET